MFNYLFGFCSFLVTECTSASENLLVRVLVSGHCCLFLSLELLVLDYISFSLMNKSADFGVACCLVSYGWLGYAANIHLFISVHPQTIACGSADFSQWEMREEMRWVNPTLSNWEGTWSYSSPFNYVQVLCDTFFLIRRGECRKQDSSWSLMKSAGGNYFNYEKLDAIFVIKKKKVWCHLLLIKKIQFL